MYRIYVAGKLNDSACGYIQNVSKMIKWANKIRKMRQAVYVPCIDLIEGVCAGDFEYEDYFNNSQEFLKVCNAVFVCPGYETSKGTQREIGLAISIGIPVFYNLEDLEQWINNQ
jgi:hypothetical protein